MYKIRKYKGGVLFVDLLGMGALTQNEIELTDEDYKPWLSSYENVENSPQYFAAAVLSRFRRLLSDMKPEDDSINIAQLSDGAFVWSEDLVAVVKFSSELMQKAIQNGVFCRGGLTCGEIIETNEDHLLGRFIVGQAVTDAVKLEGKAKGARILINDDLPSELSKINDEFNDYVSPLFAPFTNPLDYVVYDEFKWYLVPYDKLASKDNRALPHTDKIKYTKNRLMLANMVSRSPCFSWNSKSSQGLVHLKATVNFIAENKLLEVIHDFEWKDVGPKRSHDIVKNIEELIKKSDDYLFENNDLKRLIEERFV